MVEKLDPPERRPPQDMLDALAESEAELAAGLAVPFEEALERLLAKQAEIEARHARRRA